MEEARAHPHITARETVIDVDGVSQPAPAPRFSRSTAEKPCGPTLPGIGVRALLDQWGCDESVAESLLAYNGVSSVFAVSPGLRGEP
jgi:alpha-methylacyl-CoA racemase